MRNKIAFFLLMSAVAVLAALAVDLPVLRALHGVTVHENDAYRMFRVMGFLPGWLLVALAFGLLDAPRLRRMWMMAAGVILSGAAGEVLKLAFRRQRPTTLDCLYQYVPWHGLSTAGLSLPSTHVIVAFGGAWVLCRLHPRGWPVWVALATGCAVTRVISRAHFVSDCVAAALVSYAVVWLVNRWWTPRAPSE
jgi:membrane-associated phospholipid phosphatase